MTWTDTLLSNTVTYLPLPDSLPRNDDDEGLCSLAVLVWPTCDPWLARANVHIICADVSNLPDATLAIFLVDGRWLYLHLACLFELFRRTPGPGTKRPRGPATWVVPSAWQRSARHLVYILRGANLRLTNLAWYSLL